MEDMVAYNFTEGPWQGYSFMLNAADDSIELPKVFLPALRNIRDYKVYSNEGKLLGVFEKNRGYITGVPTDCYQCGHACNHRDIYYDVLPSMDPAFKVIPRTMNCFYKCKQHFKTQCLP